MTRSAVAHDRLPVCWATQISALDCQTRTNGFQLRCMDVPPSGRRVSGVVQAVPDTPVVLDHGRAAELALRWSREEVRATLGPALEKLAEHEHVMVKVGGIGMSIYGWA